MKSTTSLIKGEKTWTLYITRTNVVGPNKQIADIEIEMEPGDMMAMARMVLEGGRYEL